MEPYKNRTAGSVRNDIKSTIDRFIYQKKSDAIATKNGKPIFYVYDSYQIQSREWKMALLSLKGTRYEAYVVGLLVEIIHSQQIIQGAFNAAYRCDSIFLPLTGGS